jgi:tripartite-type tricarboxylate transporter receptor subunit TctC
MIVPAPAGAQPDLVARSVAERLGEGLRQPFVVDNRPGVAGLLGVYSSVRAAPDGYTVLVGELMQLIRLDAASARRPYDAARDLVAIAKLAKVPTRCSSIRRCRWQTW